MPTDRSPILLVCLGDDHLDDRIFMQSLTRGLGARRPGAWPCLVVHGPGAQAQQQLEAEGYFCARAAGIWAVSGAEEVAVVARATRTANREVVASLTDAVVPAIGVVGTDRNLLQQTAEAGLQAGRVAWLTDLARKRVVPVVAARALDPVTGERQVSTSDAAAALARRLTDEGETVHLVCFTTANLPGLMLGVQPEAQVNVEELAGKGVVPDLEFVRTLACLGYPLWLTNTARMGQEGAPAGTRVDC